MTPYQRFDVILGHRVSRRLHQLRTLQWAPRELLEARRGARLRTLVAFSATSVPFYRDALRERGLVAADITSPEQLPLLPILDKQTLSARFDDLRVGGYRGPTYEMKSSGSTGTRTTVLLDKACYDEVFATQLLFWSWGGFAMGERHLQTGMSLARGPVKRLKDLAFRCTYTSAFDLTDATL
jgi:phenylacetate-CoA ligase